VSTEAQNHWMESKGPLFTGMPSQIGNRVAAACCIGLNANGVVIAWNEGAQWLFGYSPTEIQGQNIYHFLSLRGLADGGFESALSSAYHDGIAKIDSCFSRKDGTRFNANCVVKPTWHRGTFRGYVLTVSPKP
jgi:PAS domain S-box-containing protein